MISTIFFSNSRSLEQPGLIIETLEYCVVSVKIGLGWWEVDQKST